MDNDSDNKASVHFLDLPQEIRDLVYLYFRSYSWIDITQMPDRIQQPSISKVSKRVRKESLDVFYGKNRFMLDMRGWKNGAWPKSWTPVDIFTRWVKAIGDENAARLRHVSFYLQNFAVHYTISSGQDKDTPRIVAKFRQTRSNFESFDISERAPAGYTVKVAMKRAEQHLCYKAGALAKRVGDRNLGVKDVLELCKFVESLKPALCSAMGMGWKGAFIEEDPSQSIFGMPHMMACNECGYYRVSEVNARPSLGCRQRISRSARSAWDRRHSPFTPARLPQPFSRLHIPSPLLSILSGPQCAPDPSSRSLWQQHQVS
ncbi:hypothetical protein M409DRAFT_53272 [Zasmidium cellare ATCC 36951]|uniref:F-box domain-containing protein n=1 Tax=Zasmidium cellare ATCC 36951 TaxID=1080233 RepID=A0A6A6CPN6_ZASCE|nr:uncharacterized protein M409DRAFT_53272 [Zasmidium cellare ATCC 36951]KAF2168633.1 hypothetical protein M409DRAFT_53272 [Zasmidium cellare ATCC 36951]